MSLGRSAKSVRSESSEEDLDCMTSDIAKLQGQLRVMERKQKAYRTKVQEQIRKQQQEIKMLLKEQEEVKLNLSVCKNLSRRRNIEDSQRLRALLEQRDKIEVDIETEKQCQKQLKAEISSLEVKRAEVRKGMIGFSDSQGSKVRKTLKAIDTLEKKLQRASNCFSEQMKKNSHLKEELQTLLTERARFQQLHYKLNKELQKVNKNTGETLNQAIVAYDVREEAQSKMNMMREKEADLAQERKRIIVRETYLTEFKSTKCFETREKVSEQEMTPRKQSYLREQKKVDSGEESLDDLEELFEQIQTVTEEDNLDLLVSQFSQTEDRNFAVFNFVTEQNNETETLRDQNSQIQNEMEQLQLQGSQRERRHHSLMRDVDEQQKESESQLEIHENQAEAMSKTLDEIISGIKSLYSKMDCDSSVIEDKLGLSVDITQNNMMSYLGLVEQKTNELITIQSFLNTKEKETDYNPTDLFMFHLGQNQDLLQPNLDIQPAVNSESYEFSHTDEEEWPLPQHELRKKIEKVVLQTRGATKTSKIRQHLSGNQHILEDEKM